LLVLYSDLLRGELMRVERSKLSYYSQEQCDAKGVCYQELDEHGLILNVNQFWLEASGLDKKCVIGYPLSDFVASGCLPNVNKHFPILKEHGEINHVRFKFQFANEEFREVLLFGRSEYDVRGRFVKTHCWFATLEYFTATPFRFISLLDKVERIQTRLTDHSNYLEWVFNSVRSLLVVVKSGKIIRANQPFLSFCGLPHCTDVTQIHTPLTRSLLREVSKCSSKQPSRQLPRIDLVNPITHKIHYFECEVTPISYADGEQVVLLTDITEQRLAQDKLAAEEARSMSYLQVARVIMIALDTSGQLTMINQKGCETLGYSEEDVIGLNWFELAIPEKQRHRDESYFYGVLDSAIDDSSDYLGHILTHDR